MGVAAVSGFFLGGTGEFDLRAVTGTAGDVLVAVAGGRGELGLGAVFSDALFAAGGTGDIDFFGGGFVAGESSLFCAT